MTDVWKLPRWFDAIFLFDVEHFALSFVLNKFSETSLWINLNPSRDGWIKHTHSSVVFHSIERASDDVSYTKIEIYRIIIGCKLQLNDGFNEWVRFHCGMRSLMQNHQRFMFSIYGWFHTPECNIKRAKEEMINLRQRAIHQIWTNHCNRLERLERLGARDVRRKERRGEEDEGLKNYRENFYENEELSHSFMLQLKSVLCE